MKKDKLNFIRAGTVFLSPFNETIFTLMQNTVLLSTALTLLIQFSPHVSS